MGHHKVDYKIGVSEGEVREKVAEILMEENG